MAHKKNADGFAQWATIEVQGNTPLKKIAKEAEVSRKKVNGTLAEPAGNAKHQGFLKFLAEVQSGRFTEKPAHNDETEEILN